MAAGGMIFIGTSRSGKTTAVAAYDQRLRELGYDVRRFDDKNYLMEEAIKDMKGLPLYDGPIETEKTTVLNPEVALTEPRKLRLVFKDGRLLNIAHERIMADIAHELQNGGPKRVVLADLAYGDDCDFGEGKVPLVQSGRQFVRWFTEYGILDRHDVLIREITAPYAIRAERNKHSDEALDEEEFRLLFQDPGPDGRGFFEAQRMVLGEKLRHIDNSTISKAEYEAIIHHDFETNFLPRIIGEGSATSHESRRPSSILRRDRR